MGQLVHVGAVGPLLAPPDAQAHHHPGPGPAVDGGVADVAAPGVEDAQPVAIGNAARGGVLGVQLQQRALFHARQAGDIGEGAVQEVARRRRDHGQRVGGRGRLVIGHVVGQGVDAQRGQARVVELALARRRGKAALGERRLGHRDVGKALGQQAVEIHSCSRKRRAAQRLIRLRKVRGGKGRVQLRHLRGQVAEDLGVAARLAFGGDGRAVQQHVGVAVAAMDVPVLQLRGGGQHVVGVVGGVGQEMLQHHGEQVLARKAGGHLGRLRGHGHGVAVVDHHGLDLRAELRIAGVQQHVADGAHVQRARAAVAQQLG